MKNLLLIACLFFAACSAGAQSKTKSKLVGFQVGFVTPKYRSSCGKNLKIGIPSFSYAASIENRFSSHRKLNFSLQYSINYLRQTKSNSSAGCRSNQLNTSYNKPNKGEVGLGLQAAFSHQINNRTAVFTGLSASQNLLDIGAPISNESTQKTTVQAKYKFQDLNTGFILGIENSTKLFNKTLFYSIQYNLGFFPFSQRALQSDPSVLPSSIQGVQIGLKYKY